MQKYVKIVSTNERFIGFKLNNLFNIIGTSVDGMTFYTNYREDKGLDFYKHLLDEEGLLDYIESISVVAREECVVETYKTKPKEYRISLKFKCEDFKKTENLRKYLTELFDAGGSTGSMLAGDTWYYYYFDENSPVKLEVEEM